MTLEEQLRRFYDAVTGAAPLASAEAIVDGGRVDAGARLRVYAHAYTARIAGVLASDYPKLDAVTGDVRALVPAYLRAHPPSDPSLREAGAHLARFLAARGDPAHLVELACLERARTEAFDGGADVPVLTRAHLATLAPAEFAALSLRLVPSSHLVELTTNADDLWDAVESERVPPAPEPATRTVLVWRRDVTVVHRRLDADEAGLVRSLAGGTTFEAVCDRLAEHPAPAERALALLVRWVDAANLAAPSGLRG